LDRICEKHLIMHLINQHILSLRGKIVTEDSKLIPILGQSYLSWAAELRRDLEALQRLKKKGTGSLDYEKYVRDLEKVEEEKQKSG